MSRDDLSDHNGTPKGAIVPLLAPLPRRAPRTLRTSTRARINRGTQKQILPRIFCYLTTAKNLSITVPFTYNFRNFSHKFPTGFLKLNLSHFTPQVMLFFVEKRNLKFSDSKM